MINPRQDNEKTIRKYIERRPDLIAQIDPEAPIDFDKRFNEIRLGAYRFDLIAPNAKAGLTIVEYKVCMTLDALGQCLIYPTGLRHYMMNEWNLPKSKTPKIRTVLVSPFIDRMVAKAIKEYKLDDKIKLRLVVKESGKIKLVDPEDYDAYTDGPDEHHFQFRDQPRYLKRRQLRWNDDQGVIEAKREGKWKNLWPVAK